MEIDGSRLYLTGIKAARNATQFAFDGREMAWLKAMYDGGVVDEEVLDKLYERILGSFERYSARQYSALGVEEWRKDFASLSSEEKKALLKALIAIGNGKANTADLSSVGKGKNAGYIQPTYSKILSKDSGITFIDQSVTGMFERRTHLGL